MPSVSSNSAYAGEPANAIYGASQWAFGRLGGGMWMGTVIGAVAVVLRVVMINKLSKKWSCKSLAMLPLAPPRRVDPPRCDTEMSE